ncbi:unnamed protein product (macronuclear) [Paramecium tetraurelia]|uniref:Uncharacterized protein n=1 Tax=Paramecium tetraurelia TaxID=5888 RepID=A0DFY9_PARTE|nr:uncharacterized protein GSPATT00002084001 [Paramecium tetraurelia]CAK81956.1 unnamed protein product [Paramecium tetraurelia]|eukprot:XP_001449353.1 hypothetical protein (macronuclear) [Paramecium tetraurelia strain d4-2]
MNEIELKPLKSNKVYQSQPFRGGNIIEEKNLILAVRKQGFCIINQNTQKQQMIFLHQNSSTANHYKLSGNHAKIIILTIQYNKSIISKLQMQQLKSKAETSFIDTVSNMMKFINDQQAFQQTSNIKEFEDNLETIQDKRELLSIGSIIQILIKSEKVQEKKNYLLKINFKIQTKILEQNQNLGAFIDELFEKNGQGIGLSFLNNDGSFVLSDLRTRELLETTKTANDSKHLLQFCSQAGQKTLYKQFKNWPILLDEDELSKDFFMTIYSERMRRKALKHLAALGNQKLKQSQFQIHGDQSKKNKKMIKEEIKLNQHEAIKIKFLKTVQIKLTKLTINVTQEFQQSVQESAIFQGSSNLDYMAENSQQYFQVVKCEIILCQEIEYISPEEINKDHKLQEYERKWQEKCKKIKDQIMHLRQDNIHSQDQSLIYFSEPDYELSNVRI